MGNLTIELLKEQYPYLSQKYGVERIGVFGSVARESDSEKSDVDIVVKLKKPIGLQFTELVEFLENLLKRKVDVLTEDGINNIRIKEIAEEIKRNILYV